MVNAPIEIVLNPSDFDEWVDAFAFLELCFAGMEDRIDPPSSLTRMTPETLREMAQGSAIVVARQYGQLVGFGFGEEKGKSLYLSKLAVHPNARRRGILRKMVTIFEAHAVDCGLDKMELQSRVELNENHIIFNTLGFEKTNETRHAGYDRVTSLTFQKTV